MNLRKYLRAHAVVFSLCLLMLSAPAANSADRVWEPIEPSGQNGVEADAPALELPTLHSIGVLWAVRGDDNGNASVSVSFRQTGSEKWREALPLFWIHPERQPAQHRVPNGRLFAGSIVGLQPGTTYDLRLQLSDTDGGSRTEHIVTATREIPTQPASMRLRHVVSGVSPGGNAGTGSKDDPYLGLASALSDAMPGDLLLLAAGVYSAQGLQPLRSGTAENPIVVRGESAEGVVIEGGDGEVALDLSGRSHIWLERVTLQNARVLLRAEDSEQIVVRGNIFKIAFVDHASGIEVLRHGAHQFLISDNRFLGPNTEWPSKYNGKKTPELLNGITIAGSGHDIAFNEIFHIGDGINTGRSSDGMHTGEGLRATDIYNNDVNETRTECIEADYSLTNIRIYENRLTNCLYAVSTQPAMGGPVYIFRNAIFNTTSGPFKLHNHTSGVLLFHNTSVRTGRPLRIIPRGETVNDVLTRNNLFIGTRGPALHSVARMVRTDFDNDGYSYGMSEHFAQWNGKRYKSAMQAQEDGEIYAEHGPIMVFGRGEFENGPIPPSGDIAPQPRQQNQPLLSADSRALDRGIRLPNFNDHYAGDAPDLGCCEYGQPFPHVGPRPEWFSD